MSIKAAIAKQNAEQQAKSAILKAQIMASGKTVRVAGGAYGVAFNRNGDAVLCFVPA